MNVLDKLKLDTTQVKFWLALVAGLVYQTGYWYLGSPGPQLTGASAPGLEAALINIGWALLWLLLLPLLTLRLLELPVTLRYGLGDTRFGVTTVAMVALLALPFLYLGSTQPELQATYPWAGAWAGAAPLNLFLWIELYTLYYLAFEFFYRGFLLSSVAARWGLEAGVGVQLIASVLIHLGKPFPEVVAAIPAGLFFAWLALRSRSLLYPTLLHLFIGVATDVFSLHHQGLLLP